jgi:hypothetical protein
MLRVNNAGATGCAACKLDRRLRAGIGEENIVQGRHVAQQPLGQHAGENGNIHLHEIGQIGIEHGLQRAAYAGMVAAQRENTEAAQKIEILPVLAVIEIGTLAAFEADIIADGLQHAHHLLVQMPGMQPVALRFPLRNNSRDVHSSPCAGLTAFPAALRNSTVCGRGGSPQDALRRRLEAVPLATGRRSGMAGFPLAGSIRLGGR